MAEDMVAGDYRVDLRRLWTPRDQCLTLSIGPIRREDVIEAEEKRYDQLPVLDHDRRLVGLVARSHARALFDEGRPLEASDGQLTREEISGQPPLLDLLDALSHHRALAIRDEARTSVDDPKGDWFALVTISDLNRHPFRAHLYPILAGLEASLAELIDRRYDDPWQWLTNLKAEVQIGLLGRWEYDKRRSIDLSPITGATLTDMMWIVANNKEQRAELGLGSGKQAEDRIKSIRDLRNQIMHPARPLIQKPGEAGNLSTTLRCILALTQRAQELSKNLEATGNHHSRVLP